MDTLAKIESSGEEADGSQIVRLKISVDGIVQGVGFRPFIYRLAHRYGLAGHVLNNPEGVKIEVQGRLDKVSDFLSDISAERPPQARVDTVSAHFADLTDEDRFIIRESAAAAERTALISPDIATCEACLSELRDKADRRFGYPFINCTNCGPRYTIIGDIPYDRANTTMHVFPMCPECATEYGDPVNRRFHAEPNACWTCGPRLEIRDSSGSVLECADPIAAVQAALSKGEIVAVKGLGGFHLAVDAGQDGAVRRLRARKHREEKPLAIMAKDLPAIRTFAEVSEGEAKLLGGPERPIVLLKKLKECRIAEAVAPGNRNLGVMLPYTPVHHMLLEYGFVALVMTSANISEEPIAVDTTDALQRLGGIADLYLDHNRGILSRCDDSVVRMFEDHTIFLRRSRGWVPVPVTIEASPPSILAVGAHLKNTIAVSRRNQVFISQHIGDLENLRAFEFFRNVANRLAKIVEVKPEIVVHDMHPDYLSTKFAESLEGRHTIAVQHHHAHIASCLGEAGIDGPVIGMALDGTGYGPDGTIWGCEVLVATRKSYQRVGHLDTVGMPGGEVAVRQPWRMAVSHLRHAFGTELDTRDIVGLVGRPETEVDLVSTLLARGVNCPVTSSCGRLFDAVSSLCRIRGEITYEGQAAIELEMVADEAEAGSYPVVIEDRDGMLILMTGKLLRRLVGDIRTGLDRSIISAKFHNWLAAGLVELALRLRDKCGTGVVALSGGCFQNEILLRRVRAGLLENGFEVLINRVVPANDGGISFGQAVVAAARVLDDWAT
jgi:hydrogenase maturation protein HypF